ncbi:hypothetical protein SRABI106_03340 [Rahnella aquatilis]|nr:hypothetical protein SRABI106_03340 [Rahnella aquatilis]
MQGFQTVLTRRTAKQWHLWEVRITPLAITRFDQYRALHFFYFKDIVIK